MKRISSEKIIATYLFYNRTKRTVRNTINEAEVMKPTKSPYTISDSTCTVITAIHEQKNSTYNYVYDSTCNYC